MIIGGHSGGITASVFKFDSSNLDSNPMQVESMVQGRYDHACTTFNSKLHDGRTVMIVAGGDDGSGDNSAEIWDFSQEGTSWEKSNLIFAFILSILMFFKEGLILLLDFF